MSRIIQIRNVPDEVHREIQSRAALAGMSMSEFVLQEMKKILERPTREELLRRITELPPVELSPAPADLVRRNRQQR